MANVPTQADVAQAADTNEAAWTGGSRWQAVFETLPIGLAIFDSQHRLIFRTEHMPSWAAFHLILQLGLEPSIRMTANAFPAPELKPLHVASRGLTFTG